MAWRERKVWLGEIGAAASLDPGALQAVIDDVILPAFQWRNFDRGIEAGLDALSRLILAQPDPPPGARTADERLTGAGAGRSTLAAALLLVIGAAMLLTRVAEVRVEEPLAR